MTLRIRLAAGTKLSIVVGHHGGDSIKPHAGGGGGSFVYSDSTLFGAAGGGGGAGQIDKCVITSGSPGRNVTDGGDVIFNGELVASGGRGGHGGGAEEGGGGAGWLSKGNQTNNYGQAGNSKNGNWTGGKTAHLEYVSAGSGGFGGGGAGKCCLGVGGGGGYSGGAGGGRCGGGGGGSFCSPFATSCTKIKGGNSRDKGYVRIQKVE